MAGAVGTVGVMVTEAVVRKFVGAAAVVGSPVVAAAVRLAEASRRTVILCKMAIGSGWF